MCDREGRADDRALGTTGVEKGDRRRLDGEAHMEQDWEVHRAAERTRSALGARHGTRFDCEKDTGLLDRDQSVLRPHDRNQDCGLVARTEDSRVRRNGFHPQQTGVEEAARTRRQASLRLRLRSC